MIAWKTSYQMFAHSDVAAGLRHTFRTPVVRSVPMHARYNINKPLQIVLDRKIVTDACHSYQRDMSSGPRRRHTFRRTSISARKSPKAMSEVFFKIFAATMVPYHVALCTTPNSPSPADEIDQLLSAIQLELARRCNKFVNAMHCEQHFCWFGCAQKNEALRS